MTLTKRPAIYVNDLQVLRSILDKKPVLEDTVCVKEVFIMLILWFYSTHGAFINSKYSTELTTREHHQVILLLLSAIGELSTS